MHLRFGTVNGFHIKGKTLKRLIFSTSGVLTYEGKRLTFVSLPDMKKAVYEPVDYEAERKVVFASNEFSKVKELYDDEPYLVIFTKGMMQIHLKHITQEPIIIYGESL